MVTGQLPFRGDSSATIFESILNRVPAPAVRLNPEVPPKLEEIINKALEKDRNLRYQHAADMRTDLQRLKRDSDSHSSPSATITNAQANFERKRGYVAAVIIAAVLVAAAAVGFWYWRAKSTTPQITSIAVLPFVNATSDANNLAMA
jgi:serine/threonine protein kinase